MKELLLLLGAFFNITSSARSLSLPEALKVLPGKITRSQLVHIFGKPDKKNIFKEPPKGEGWEYREDGLERLSFFFDEGSDIAHSWAWGMNNTDPEKDLKTAQSRFPNAGWNVETTKWINPHFFPHVCFYNDEKLGVSLEFNLVRREVDRIYRWNPERKLASTEDDKRPTYCIGTACSPAIPASEFFKDRSVAKYCEEVH